MLVAREGKAGIDDDDAVVAFDDHHVLPDLAQPPERDQSRGARHGLDPRSLKDACALEHGAKLGLLPVGRVDERKPWDPDVVARDRHCRFDRNRVRVDRKRVDDRPELGLDLTRALEVALLEAGQQIAHPLARRGA